ncbi:MAG: serine/threonine-protein kinase [Gemmatimonadetes bacterium]|nr:serine/threonine-protein kinase [Gemmatimonadota bacterium]
MSDQFERLKTALADRYAIERELGEGGMAKVYLARDLKHDRSVAVKVLRPELAAVLGAERFLNEIRVTANLQHPHIVQLYDSGEAGGDLYYVMPFIDGESLREKLNRENQLSIDEAVAITRAVAEALDYAHRRDVIHRDIKPENIMLLEGTPLVADFGIALAISNVAGDRITATGLSLGTPSYMSPEQATGDRQLTAQSDTYALGSVLYEMLAGDPPFTGSNITAVIAKVIGEKPIKLSTIRDTVPANIEAAVAKALAKVPADRFESTKAFAEALVTETPVALVEDGPSASMWARARRVAVPAGVAGLLVWALFGRGGDAPTAGMTGYTISRVTGFAGWEISPSWSPDGSQITYSHTGGGDADVATLSLGSGDPHILTADSPYDEIMPRWSRDGSKIAFLSDRGTGSNIYWIPPTGGAERLVAETNIPSLERMFTSFFAMGTNPWSVDSEELLFSKMDAAGDVALWKVNLSTGEQTQLTTPPPVAEDGWASWSSDGTRIVFQRFHAGVPQIWLLPTEGGEPSMLPAAWMALGPSWLPGDEKLVATSMLGGAPNIWEFDLATLEPRQITSGGAGQHWTPAVGPTGSIAYSEFDHQVDLHWIPIDAPDQDERITFFTGENFGPRLSPDGNHIVWMRGPPYDLWLYDRTTDESHQLTTDPADRPGAADRMGDWSPDGDEIVFLSDRGGAVQLWIVDVATGITRQLSDHELPWSPHVGDTQAGPRWAPDGSVIGYLAPGEDGNAIWLIDPDGSNRRESTVRDAFSFGWYKDGQRVVYTRRAPDGSGQVELRAAHLGTGEDVLLFAGALSEVSVSPDGSALTYISSVSHFTMELQMLRLAPTSSPEQLPTIDGDPQQLTFGNGEWHVHGGGWAWDGSGLVYSRDRDYGDIYLIKPNR